MGGSMWRHYYRSGVGAYPDGDYVGGLPRTQLKVRAISTMGNYGKRRCLISNMALPSRCKLSFISSFLLF